MLIWTTGFLALLCKHVAQHMYITSCRAAVCAGGVLTSNVTHIYITSQQEL